MRVLFKIKGKVETVANVSVDDKCFPLVRGIHPFSASSKSRSPLALESSLWFKTLAVDSIYVDCDSSVIFWLAVKNDSISGEVKLRKKESLKSYHSEFVPDDAKPLVNDLALFEFDASYKEMIVKSHEVAKKFTNKSVSANDLNSLMANLLHVYILPSITFAVSDLFALSRARCLIEERHQKADADISAKAQSINLLQLSLDNLKENLLLKDDFESETYLQTCNVKFLKAFLIKIEEDSIKLNLDLEAQQSKVNWAKEQGYDKKEIAAFQKTRDGLFKEIERLIKVREALKNVLTRKTKIKKKKARKQIMDSCFHNVFLEILRRLEVENKSMEQLVEDKLNISAAREAILSVILGFEDHKRISSDRSTRFEPSSFGDYHRDGTVKMEKSDAWLTLQERVSKVLKENISEVCPVHTAGCKNIKLQIDIALSEFHLHAKKQTNVESKEDGERSTELKTSEIIIDVEMSPDKDKKYDLSVDQMAEDSDMTLNQRSTLGSENPPYDEATLRTSLRPTPRSASLHGRRSGAVFSTDSHIISLSDAQQNKDIDTNMRRESSEGVRNNVQKTCPDDLDYVIIDDPEFSGTTSSTAVENKNHFISENLAINTLMAVVENVKTVIHEHFREVVKCLQEVLNPESMDPFEILWKAYERHFSMEVLDSLTLLYHTMLEPGSKDVYTEIRRTSMQELMEGDKILNLFIKPRARHLSTSSFDDASQTLDAISMAKTISNMSLDVRHYSVNELYKLANADSNDMCRRFKLETDDQVNEVISGSPSSSESGASVKTEDLFNDEDDEGFSHSVNSLSQSSRQEYTKRDTLESNQSLSFPVDEGKEFHANSSDISSDAYSENSMFLSPHEIIDMMDPFLSPFRKQITKCIKAGSVLDKMRYLSKGVQNLNSDISILYGTDHVSACDDIISMLVLSLANMPEDIFVGLYSNIRLLIDILPSFLTGTLSDFNLVSLVAAYDFLLHRNVCQRIVKRYAASFKVNFSE